MRLRKLEKENKLKKTSSNPIKKFKVLLDNNRKNCVLDGSDLRGKRKPDGSN